METILAYALVQTAMQLIVKPLVDKMQAGRKIKEQLDSLRYKQQLDVEAALMNREVSFCYDQQMLREQFENSLKLREQDMRDFVSRWSIQTDFQTCWPLTNTLVNPCLKSSSNGVGVRPVMVFVTEPACGEQYAGIMHEVNKLLGTYLTHSFFHPNSESAIINQIGAWKPGFNSFNNINNLYEGLKLQPCVVINPSFKGERVNLYVSSWSQFYEGSAPVQERSLTIDLEKLNEEEKVRRLSFSIACLAGLYADVYHLIEKGVKPKMPVTIKEFCREYELPYQISNDLIGVYKTVLYGITCSNYFGSELPSIYLNVAESLKCVENEYGKKMVLQIAKESIILWANQRQGWIEPIETQETCLNLIQTVLKHSQPQDYYFINHLVTFYQEADVSFFYSLKEITESVKCDVPEYFPERGKKKNKQNYKV